LSVSSCFAAGLRAQGAIAKTATAIFRINHCWNTDPRMEEGFLSNAWRRGVLKPSDHVYWVTDPGPRTALRQTFYSSLKIDRSLWHKRERTPKGFHLLLSTSCYLSATEQTTRRERQKRQVRDGKPSRSWSMPFLARHDSRTRLRPCNPCERVHHMPLSPHQLSPRCRSTFVECCSRDNAPLLIEPRWYPNDTQLLLICCYAD
jgi:hypothetical protein